MHPAKTHLIGLLVGLSLVLLSGCSTINSRIRENQALFDGLPADTQDKIRQGVVEVGYTPQMVFMAMGEPHERRSTRAADRESSVWIYNVYYQDWVGRRMAGYRRVVVYDEKTKKHYVYVEPVYEDLYRDRKEERIRIEFDRGVVSAIEERK